MYHYEYGPTDSSSTMHMLQPNMDSKKTKRKNKGNEIASQGRKGARTHEKMRRFIEKRVLFIHFKKILPSPDSC
jgi:hypothetical protein